MKKTEEIEELDFDVEEKSKVEEIEEKKEDKSIAETQELELNDEDRAVEAKFISELGNSEKDSIPKKKSNKGLIIAVILLLVIVGGGIGAYFVLNPTKTVKKTNNDSKKVYSEFRMSGNGLEDFDLKFLKLENEAKNKVYSPLSIKYALEMLAEGSNGETKKQLDAVIGDYKAKKYPNNEHMSFANAMFIRNTYKDKVKKSYTDNLTKKYNAEVIYDEFNDASNMNNWVSEKTFKLIDNLFETEKIKEENFILTNALAIDMNWNNQIQCASGSTVPCKGYSVRYAHEKYKDDYEYSDGLIYITSEGEYHALNFNGKDNIKSLTVKANFNRYDAVKEIGEEKIRKEVGDAYREWLKTDGKNYATGNDEYYPADVDKYLDKYIEELNENYKKSADSTDFMLYTDDNVKVFAKDLQEYDGTTLQYVGIMPKKESLDKYIENIEAKDITKIISNLKEMKIENFKDGVVTVVKGYIPVFKYDYDLDLLKDLPKLGIKDVFNINKADLSNMLKEGQKQYIDNATHKATIEFSNDGIKAAAATQMGGAGAASGGFNYLYEIPVEEIDLTFDKPYMYLIRDKETGEVWFTGTVYEPIERSVPYNPNDYNY